MNHNIVEIPNSLSGIDIVLENIQCFGLVLRKNGETGTQKLRFGFILKDGAAAGDIPLFDGVGDLAEMFGSEGQSQVDGLLVVDDY